MNKNILIIVSDQLSATALKTYSNTYAKKRSIDNLATQGVIIENAYTTCPLCQPARASLWSSKYPHQTRVLSNHKDQGFDVFSDELPTLGDLFNSQGYECVHFGKTHDYGALRGFEIYPQNKIKRDRDIENITLNYETFLDENTTRQAEKYLGDLDDKQRFLAIVDLQNPHNICSYVGDNEFGYKPFAKGIALPKLPDNYEFDDIFNRPMMIKYMCCGHRRQSQTMTWNEDDYRHYLYAYHYYIDIVDKQIKRVLNALEKSGLKENTLIAFVADHGEGMAGHRFVTKYGSFYEESNRVPFIFAGNTIKGGRRIKGVSSTLDLVPTLLDYANIDIPTSLEGTSLYPQITGKKDITDTKYACGEWSDDFQAYRVPGRMYVDDEYKYTIYKDCKYDDQNGVLSKIDIIQEELYDMKNDRLEKKNLVMDDKYKDILDIYKYKLNEHFIKTNDSFHSLECDVEPIYRCHEVGVNTHTGPVQSGKNR